MQTVIPMSDPSKIVEATEEVECEVVPEEEPPYPWTQDPEEMRRCFIFEHMASSEVDGKILVQNMEMVFRWIISGTIPSEKTASKLKAVPKEPTHA